MVVRLHHKCEASHYPGNKTCRYETNARRRAKFEYCIDSGPKFAKFRDKAPRK